jgi:hypothetical protein
MARLILGAGMILTLLWVSGACVTGTEKRQIVSGTIRVVGNEPLTHLIIRPASRDRSDANQDILVTGALAKELRSNFQGKSVSLEGTFCASPSPQFARCFKPSKITID